MAVIDLELSNGEIVDYEVPDDWSDEQIQSSIKKNFGRPDWKDVLKESFQQRIPNQELNEATIQAGRPAAASIARFGENIGNIPNSIEESLFSGPGRLFGKTNLGSKSIDIPEEQKGMFDKFSGSVPEQILGLGLGPMKFLGRAGESFSQIPMAGKYLKTLLQQRPIQEAATQSAIAGGFAPEDQGKSAAIAGVVSLPVAKIAEKIGKMTPETSFFMKALRSFIPSKRAEQELLEKATQTDYKPYLEAAERQGLRLTPAEATGDKILAAREASLGKNNVPVTREYIEKVGERQKKEEKIIDSLTENIISKKDYPKIDELYTIANPVEIPENILNKFKNEKYYKEAKAYAEKEYNLEGLSENSIEYVDKIRDALLDLAEGAKRGKARELNTFRKNLVKEADLISPEYKAGRNLKERQHAREGVEEFFDAKAKTGENFADYLKSKKKYNKLEFHLRNNPESIQQLRDMKLIFERVEKINKEKLGKQAIAGEKGPKEALINKFMNTLTGKHAYDEAGVKLITDPKWADRLHKLSTVSSREKFLSEAMNIFGKALSQESSKFKRGEFGKSMSNTQE